MPSALSVREITFGCLAAQAIAGGDADASVAADYFLRFLGRVAGDLSLAFLPFGGVYLSGEWMRLAQRA